MNILVLMNLYISFEKLLLQQLTSLIENKHDFY